MLRQLRLEDDRLTERGFEPVSTPTGTQSGSGVGLYPGPEPIIAPSLLAARYESLAAEVRRVERSGAEWLHVDIMDGHFVPNLSFGPGMVRALRPLTRLFVDVHLMCARPEILLEPFAEAGADQITVHVELGERVARLLWKVRSLGKRVGLAINPPTTMAQARPFLGQVDLLLVMTVNPGFGGQSFIREALPKIQQARDWRRELRLAYRISVDGGIDLETASDCAHAGADTFVSGTALFEHHRLKSAVARMRQRVRSAASGAESARAAQTEAVAVA